MPPKRKILSQEEKESALQEYLSGARWSELTQKYRMSHGTLKKNLPPGIPRRLRKHKRKNLTQEEKQNLVNDRINGASYDELQSKYGISRDSVIKYIPKEYRVRSMSKRHRKKYIPGRVNKQKLRERKRRVRKAVDLFLKKNVSANIASRSMHVATCRVYEAVHNTFPGMFTQYTTEFRKKVVREALETSPRQAATLNKVSKTSVYDWMHRSAVGKIDALTLYHRRKKDA